MDHQWLLPFFTCVLTHVGQMPVARPGCPMDHIQTLVNRSPGDLWLRCIGSIRFSFPLFSPSVHGIRGETG